MPEPSRPVGADAVNAHSRPPSTKPCRYFASKSGCRAGSACPYKHEIASDPATLPDRRRYQAAPVPSPRVVPRPVPAAQLEDPREFQLGQIRRRFSPVEKTDATGTSFTINLVPSDPDFPYEVESLECLLSVPRDYPEGSRPTMRVVNKDMPRGFQINVEQGFDELVADAPSATLLGLFNRLDKALADLLSRPIAETIKLYRPLGSSKIPGSEAAVPPSEAKRSTPVVSSRSPPSYTEAEKADAAAKRQTEVRQIVARLGKAPGFIESSDGVTFTLPQSIFRTQNAPASITQATSMQLIVPQMYPLLSCRVQFQGTRTDEMSNVETAFLARNQPRSTSALLAQINYLSQNLNQMALTRQQTVVNINSTPPAEASKVGGETTTLPMAKHETLVSDKPHVHIIPRPLEWMQAETDEESSTDSSFSEESEAGGEEAEEPDTDVIPTSGGSLAQKGIMISFPNLELHGIELLELVSLSLTVKCNRCKEVSDFERLRNNTQGDHTGMKEQGCKKCASSLAAGYRMDLIHINSSRAGYIDLDGCTAVDMLPSTFVPTCAECSTAYTTPGCVSVRGDSTLAVCRECHRKMSFRIQEVKFLLVSAAAERATRGLIRKKVRENLGIIVGQELPRRGKCQHYAKSYRWFRFSCCSKVFPCDKCHDVANPDHVVEFANRMICGYCSREQNYRPEDCGVCHSMLIGKKGHGFWEGGKGTRDPARMSRKDPRKYKRRPGTKPKS